MIRKLKIKTSIINLCCESGFINKVIPHETSPLLLLSPNSSIVLVWFFLILLNKIKRKETENKRPMGHIAHLRKQFKSINTYNYIITLVKRRKKPIIILMRIKWFFFEQNWIPFTQGCFVPSLVKIGRVVLEKKLF